MEEKIDIMAFDKETSEIIALRAAKRKELEKKAIEANIAQRDAFREAKQKWEDNGMPGPFNPYYKESIQKYVEAAHEDKKETEARKELKTLEVDIEKEIHKAKKEFIEKVEKEINPPEIQPIEATIEIRTQTAQDFRNVANEINGETSQIKWLTETPRGIAMMAEYSESEGGHAIWREKITNGFKDWCESNGYKIGE